MAAPARLGERWLNREAPNNFLNPGVDTALFSLAPSSPSLMQADFRRGDVFKTSFGGSFSLYATAASLGPLPADNIDALDIHNAGVPPELGALVPEPGTQMLALFGLVPFGFIARRPPALVVADLPDKSISSGP